MWHSTCLRVRDFLLPITSDTSDDVCMTFTAKMTAAQPQFFSFTMLASYDEYDIYWQNGAYKKISKLIFAECQIFRFLIFDIECRVLQVSLALFSSCELISIISTLTEWTLSFERDIEQVCCNGYGVSFRIKQHST